MSEKRKKSKRSKRKSRSDSSERKKRKSSKSKRSKKKEESNDDELDQFLNELTELRVNSGVIDSVKNEEEDKPRVKIGGRNTAMSKGGKKSVRFNIDDGFAMERNRGEFMGRGGVPPRNPAMRNQFDPRMGRGGFGGRENMRGGGMGRPPMSGPPPYSGGGFGRGIPNRGMNTMGHVTTPQIHQGQDRNGPTYQRDNSRSSPPRGQNDFKEIEQHFTHEMRKVMKDFHRMYGQYLKDPNTGIKPLNVRLSQFFHYIRKKITKDLDHELSKTKGELVETEKKKEELKEKLGATGNERDQIDERDRKIKEMDNNFQNTKREHQQVMNDMTSQLSHVRQKKMKYKKFLKQLGQEKTQVEEILSKVKEENERYTLTVEEKEKRLEELEQEIARLHQDLNDTTRSHEEYRQRTKQSRKRLKTSHRQYLRKHEELESQSRGLREEVENLEKKITTLQTSNSGLKDGNDQLEEKNDKLGDTNQELLRQNSEIEKKYDELIKKHEEMQGRGKKMGWKHQEIERKNSELLLRNEENARLMKELKETSDSLKDTNLEKSRKLASLLEEMNHLKLNSFETIKRLKKECLQSQSQVLKLTDVYSKRTGENEVRQEAVEAQLKQVRNENRTLRFQLDKSQKKYIDLAKQVNTFKEAHDITADSNKKLRGRLELVTRDSSNLRTKIESSHRLWTEKVNNLQREKRHLMAEKMALTEKTQSLSDEVISTHHKLSQSVSQEQKTGEMYEGKTREAQKIRTLNEKYQQQILKLEGDIRERDDKLSQILNEKQFLETVSTTRHADFKDQIERGSQEAEAWRERYESLNSHYKENVTQHFILKKQHEELNVEFLRVQRENQERIDSLETRIRELVSERRELDEKYHILIDDFKEEKKVREDFAVKSGISNKEKEHALTESERLRETIDSVIHKKEHFEKKSEELMSLIQENNVTMNTLREKNLGFQDEIMKFNGLLNSKDCEIKETEESVKKIKQQFKNEVFFRTSQNNKLIQENTRLVNDNHTLRNKITEISKLMSVTTEEGEGEKGKTGILPNFEFGKKEQNEYIELKVKNTELVGINTGIQEENDRLKRDLDLVKIKYQQQLRTAKKDASKFKRKLKKIKKEEKIKKKNLENSNNNEESEVEEELEELEEEEDEELDLELENKNKLKIEIFEKENRINDLETVHSSQKERIKELEIKISETNKKYKNTLKSLVDLQQSKFTTNNNINNNNNKKEELEKEEIMKKLLDETEEENENLKIEVSELKSEIIELSKKIVSVGEGLGMKDNNNNNKNNKLISEKIKVEEELKYLKIQILEKEEELKFQKIEFSKISSGVVEKDLRINELENNLKLEKVKYGNVENELIRVRLELEKFEKQKEVFQKIMSENLEMKKKLERVVVNNNNNNSQNSQSFEIKDSTSIKDVKNTFDELTKMMKEKNGDD